MKKKILIVILVLILLIVAALVYAALNLNNLVARFKPDLERTASQALDMPVKLGLLEASIFPETKITVKDLKLGGQEQSEAFKLDALVLSVRLSPLIFSKRLEITKLSLEAPDLTITKTASGVNVSGLPKMKKAPNPEPAAEQNKEQKQAASKLDISLQGFEVKQARLKFVNFLPGKPPLVVDQADLQAGVSLSGELIEVSDLNLTARALDNLKVVFKAAKATMNSSSGQIELPKANLSLNKSNIQINGNYNFKESSATGDISSDGIDILDLSQALKDLLPPAAMEFNPQGRIAPAFSLKARGKQADFQGDIRLEALQAQVKQFHISALTGVIKLNGDLAKQQIKTEELTFKLNESPVGLTIESALSLPQIDLSKLAVNAFGGSVNSEAKIQLGTAPGFSASSKIANIDINTLMKALSPGSDLLVGKLESVEANLQGSLDARFLQNLKGNASYVLTDGALKGFNLGALVLKAVNNVALFSGSLYDKLQSKRELFDVADTVVKRSAADLNIANGSMYTDNLILNSTAYDLSAKGRIGFDTEIDLNAGIHFTKEISELLTQSVKELSKALDREGRLKIPLALSGKPPAITVLPDIKELLEMAAKAAIREKAGDLVGEAIKRKTGIDTRGLDTLLGF